MFICAIFRSWSTVYISFFFIINPLPTTTMCSTAAPAMQHPRFPQTSNAVQHSPGIETWALILASLFDSQLNQTNLNPFKQNSQLIDPQPLFPLN